MSVSLQSITKDGNVYQRRSEIEELIYELEALPIERLVERCVCSEHLIPMEVLLYFLRNQLCSFTKIQYKELFLALAKRLEGNLQRTIHEWQFEKAEQAEDLRQEVLDRFVELLVKDRNEGGKRLDYFEVNFNSAFSTLRIDVLRQIGPFSKKGAIAYASSIENDSNSEIRSEIEISALEISDLKKSIFHDSSFRIQFQKAINGLPDDERRVIGLYLQGIPIESKDDDKITISSLLGCTDRTVRNRLKRAHVALKDKLLLEVEL